MLTSALPWYFAFMLLSGSGDPVTASTMHFRTLADCQASQARAAQQLKQSVPAQQYIISPCTSDT